MPFAVKMGAAFGLEGAAWVTIFNQIQADNQ